MFDISLRAVTEKDLPFLADVYKSTRLEEVAQTGWLLEKQDAFLQQQFDAQHRHYQEHYSEASFDLIVFEHKTVGRLYVSRWEGEIRIVDIALLSEFRGRGIGTHLLKNLMSEAKRNGQQVSIHVEKNNPALHWYLKLGFKADEASEKGLYSLMKTQFFLVNPSKSDTVVL